MHVCEEERKRRRKQRVLGERREGRKEKERERDRDRERERRERGIDLWVTDCQYNPSFADSCQCILEMHGCIHAYII